EQRERLERGRGMAALERIHRHVEHRHVVGHEEGVEFRRLEPPDQVLEARKVEIRVRPRARIAPRAGMDARRPHERIELDLTRGHTETSKGWRVEWVARRSTFLRTT